MATEIQVVNDNTDLFLSEFERKVRAGLAAIGATAERHAKANCPVDTGRLRNSITFATAHEQGGGPGASAVLARPADHTVYIGTNVEYAPPQEFYNYSHKTGKAHFLRDAASTHGKEYQAIMKASLED